MGLMYYIGSMGIFLLSLLKLTPAKPQGRGVVEALKSIFNHKGAPDSSFSLPADPSESLSVTNETNW